MASKSKAQANNPSRASTPRVRDYRAEYNRRIERGKALGQSRAQARGHAVAGERSSTTGPPKPDARLEAALRIMRETGSQSEAARRAGVSPERFRRFLREGKLAERQGRTWVFTDARHRRISVYSNGKVRTITVSGFEPASLAMAHRAAVRAFLDSGDIELLAPFHGVSVIDAKGKSYPLETRPNVLYRLAATGNEAFEQIYKIII